MFIFSWDKTYSTENDYYDKHGLEGEVWFGEESMDRVLKWCERNKDLMPLSSYVLDLGMLLHIYGILGSLTCTKCYLS